MSNNNNTIALDLDGVVLDFNTHWVTVAEAVLERPIPRLNDRYNLLARYGLTKDEGDLVWEALNAGQWSAVPSYEGTKDVIDELHAMGLNIVCITASEKACEPLRRLSLAHLNLHGHEIEFTGHYAGGFTKHEAILKHKPLLFVDDQIYNLRDSKECGVPHQIWVDRREEQLKIDEGDIHQHYTHRITSLQSLPDIVRTIRLEQELPEKALKSVVNTI